MWFYTLARGPVSGEHYSFARDSVAPHLPTDIETYHSRKVRASQREEFDKALENLPAADKLLFDAMYHDLCRDVAVLTADAFNDAISKRTKSGARQQISDAIAHEFLRLGDNPYILCGTDGRSDFAVAIPGITEWKRDWQLRDIVASPDIGAEQSKVLVDLTMRQRGSVQDYSIRFHVQIRWSHGKFNGNPEAKLYKEFAWKDIQFFESLLFDSPIVRLEVIGKGGFGVVYKGFLAGSKQPVAIKEISAIALADADDPDNIRRRFAREVEIQAGMTHPGIASVVTSDLSATTPWFATPLAEGSLLDVLDVLPQDERRLRYIYLQVLEAVDFAHKHAVLHRDIKPGNILLFANDVAKLTDFGLGFLATGNEGTRITKSSGYSMGSFPYVSPEQRISLKYTDHRTDIYALGVTLFSMLAGREPDDIDLDLSIIPALYRAFVQKCTQEEPSARFQTVGEMITEFARLGIQR